MESNPENDDEFEGEMVPLFGENLSYRCPDGRCLRLLQRQHPTPQSSHLFADNIWPGSRAMADFLLSSEGLHLCRGKAVVELGAGFALPSLVAYSLGATCLTVVNPAEFD